MDEGYIKFQSSWKKTSPFLEKKLETLCHFRQKLFDLNLIGAYGNGIGFGNISRRIKGTNQFYISGSATGNLKKLNENHFSKVTDVNIDKNELTCEGPIIASSESMSHAVIFENCKWVNGVIHVHHLGLWESLLHQVPTTSKSATYGTPEMAYSIIDLLQNSDLTAQKIFVMEGHIEGIFSFGKDLQDAFDVLFEYYQKWKTANENLF